MDEHARKLARLKAYNEQCMAEHKAWDAAGFVHAAKPLATPFPDDRSHDSSRNALQTHGYPF